MGMSWNEMRISPRTSCLPPKLSIFFQRVTHSGRLGITLVRLGLGLGEGLGLGLGLWLEKGLG